ncbi:hypothetical protein BU25DRAFT_356183 [Macroventuria anomochaeta]|uniref:Uncharacterized protein n=1 Tax=Macroventuria anomochaeta TaxID=301207 RepID=A0ACB6SHJ9_9PLEO|nr:uncharacterized protein BU25DRAFT_356183 [Macroventuria anomochaeta]KAF2633641.1 hypothetical protein BU25DRAFT_356183 [Macroventuria anomochaeta]
MERRNSHDSTLSRRESVQNVFDDEYEIDFDEDDFMVSDGLGFRQTHADTETRNGHPQESDRNETPQRQYSTSKAPGNDLRRTATRNSTAKVRNSMVQDGRPPGLSNRPPIIQSPLQHRDSVSSTASFATTSMSENPFRTGPSHPYGMYPQHTMDRSNSIATASTGTQDRPMSIQRPAHPYAMYSQSGLDDETPIQTMQAIQPTVPQIQTAMPVGFPGLNNGYHRVLGPDGEEQDIIGPDGHTEQLPPYSRYPDEGPTKASMAAEASASRIIPAPLNPAIESEDPFNAPASPVSPLSEASFSAHALSAASSEPLLPAIAPARLPPQRPETQTGNLAPISSASTVPAAPSDSSSASLLTAESGEFNEKYNEKDDPESTKPSWRKKRLFGKVPMGVVVVVLLLLLIFAVALGAAIGTFAAKKHNGDDKKGHGNKPEEEPQPQVTGPSGSLFGATPIPTPSGFSSLPTGAFSLPLGFPQEANPGCLVQANEYSAWSCKMTFAPIILTINNTGVDSNGNQQQGASTRGGALAPDGVIQYGAQTPQLDLEPMQLVLDLDYKNYGPAYHFSARYDKIVVLRPEELTAGSSLKKRETTDDTPSRQRFTVQPGDYPWYCYWNRTYIEGYIYAEDNSTAASFTALPTTWPTNPPSSTVPDTVTFAAATFAPTSTTTTLPNAAADVIPTSSSIARRDAIADAAASSSRIPPYPRIVKIEERRLPGSPQPYCQRMVLLDNGKIAPAPNGNDPVLMLWLQEQDPSYAEYFTATASAQSKRDVERRGDPADSCHCQWMFK